MKLANTNDQESERKDSDGGASSIVKPPADPVVTLDHLESKELEVNAISSEIDRTVDEEKKERTDEEELGETPSAKDIPEDNALEVVAETIAEEHKSLDKLTLDPGP